jgi:hypothetical protein
MKRRFAQLYPARFYLPARARFGILGSEYPHGVETGEFNSNG